MKAMMFLGDHWIGNNISGYCDCGIHFLQLHDALLKKCVKKQF